MLFPDDRRMLSKTHKEPVMLTKGTLYYYAWLVVYLFLSSSVHLYHDGYYHPFTI